MCQQYCNKMIAEFTEKKSKDVGDATMQEYINRYLKEQESYEENEAEEKFEEAWKDAYERV